MGIQQSPDAGLIPPAAAAGHAPSAACLARSRHRRAPWLPALLALVWLSARPGAAADDWRAWEAARVRLHAARIACLERDYRAAWNIEPGLAHERAELRRGLEALCRVAPPVPTPGVRLEAYIAANDDSPQPFWRYLPRVPALPAPPLLLFLHGYNPQLDLVNAPGIPASLTNLAESLGVCLAAPFGRGNTDFQGIGEQDVLRVAEEMSARFGCDPRRVVLMGHSMGGLGAWCLGARFAERFNAILVLSGRADFYVWHRLGREALPPWQRLLVDTQFATLYLDRLAATPVLALHGALDDIVSRDQGAFPVSELRRLGGTRAGFVEFADTGHDCTGAAMEHPATQRLLREGLTQVNPRPPPRGRPPGHSGSRLQDALLEPFLFVGGDTRRAGDGAARLEARAEEWRRFAHARPPLVAERDLEIAAAAAGNLFVFGEPEESELARTILEAGGVTIEATHFTLAGRRLPRLGHGLWFTGFNPFNSRRTAVVQCGLPWGAGLPDNHRYDRIPEVIVYSQASDRWGCNLAVAAGFLDAAAGVRWCDPPVTAAILSGFDAAP